MAKNNNKKQQNQKQLEEFKSSIQGYLQKQQAIQKINAGQSPEEVERNSKTKEQLYFDAEEGVASFVNQHLATEMPRIPNLDIASYATCLNMYLRGLPRSKIAEYTGISAEGTLKTWAQNSNWDELRERLFSRVTLDIFEQITSEEVKHSKELLKKIRPITNRLSVRALAAADSAKLDAKDILTQAREFIRLQGQFTGELQDNKNVSVGPNEVFTAIMNKVNGKTAIEIEAEVPEDLKIEPKLLG